MPKRKDGEMSATYVDQEKKNTEDVANQEGKEAGERTVVFWAPSPGYKIGNYVEEKWSGGRCVQHEASLGFMNHILVCDPDLAEGKKQLEFVEKSNAFEAGIIKRCKDMDEAMSHTAKLQAMRKITQLKCEEISMTVHKE